MRIACFTSFTFAELPAAQVMARSLKRVHPDWEVWAAIPDLPPPGLPGGALAMFDVTLGIDLLGLAGRQSWLFGHTAEQVMAASRARMLQHLLSNGASLAIHLAPNMAVFAPLRPTLYAAGEAPMVLSPRHVVPTHGFVAQRVREALAAADGVYDPGFLAVAAEPDGLAFAAWWAARLDLGPATGLAFDRKPLDLAPARFGARVTRDPGCNVAPWNLAERRIGVDAAGDFTVGDSPLRCIQFADALPDAGPEDNPIAYELAGWHAEQVRRAAALLPPPTPWAWGIFQDGTPIPDAGRTLYSTSNDLRAAFPNPFASGEVSFQAWLRAQAPELMEPPA